MHGHRHGRLWRHHNSTRHSHPFAPSSSLFMGCLLGLSRCPVVCVLAGAVSALFSAEHCLRVSPDTTCPMPHARLVPAYSLAFSVVSGIVYRNVCPFRPWFSYAQEFRSRCARCSESIKPKVRFLTSRPASPRRARQLAHATASATAAPSRDCC